ncbi:MAG: DUF3943 domain-containing protein [Moritella sp.]|uniref:DUF3943 domain-containing protein n=1 Tax=Moritella sp. TaxID=78556 RepID=UPI0025EEFADB|nr:DUF3943 domain-containing protein [Moritella sp.]NQZ91390.1 DUF3943 domain-containing protein [Moritella sp.]
MKPCHYLHLILLCTLLSPFSSAAPNEENASENTLVIANTFSNTSWEDKALSDDAYADPYQISLFSTPHGEDGERLWSQTKSVAWYGIGVAGFLALLPTDITNWETSDERLIEKWWDNVRQGPVWDRDAWYINYIGHPYFGGVYYQSARKSGYRQWDAFIYSALMSTFYWEYGIEAFAEVPALQDLVVTPVLGWVYGEWAFNQEREIILGGGTVWGSAALGDTALFFLDPVDSIGRGINQLVGKQVVIAGTGYVGIKEVSLPNGSSETQVKINLRYAMGNGKGNSTKARSDMYNSAGIEDPVDFGIVGFSVGSVYLNLDESWGLENGWAPTFSLGLYFTPQFSSRLSYSRGEMKEKTSAERVVYENYSVDLQYYFNADNDFRPYISAGLGEALKDQDRDIKTAQVNAGFGVYYKLDRNWALQLSWHHYYGTKFSANDDLASGQLIYRFGAGEH